jgi:hypothetical protein
MEGDIMFASLFVSPRSSSGVWRARTILQCIAFGLISFADTAQATTALLCKPALAFQQVGFSPINFETMQRRWTATLLVDASACATTSGRFEILFGLWSETSPDDEFIRAFTWTPGLTAVAVNVTADEAIGGYLLQNIATCPCRE